MEAPIAHDVAMRDPIVDRLKPFDATAKTAAQPIPSGATHTIPSLTSPTSEYALHAPPVSSSPPSLGAEQQEPLLMSPSHVSNNDPASATTPYITSSVATVGYPALANAPSTPSWAKLILPILCIACHAVFYYGQTEPMWKLHVNATVDAWLNATDYVARRTIDTMGLDYDNNLVVREEKDVQTFTYYFAIHELWSADGLRGGTVMPRMAAILLIVFSGLWPHLKLIMLNLTWFIGKHPKRRTRTLQWLSGLGKWSLADVLVVCVMVGVLHLDWIVDPAEIKQGVITDLPALIQIVQSLYTPEELCDKLLHMECATQKRVTNIAKCKACHAAVSECYYHPEVAQSTASTILNGCTTSGGGLATMRVIGMRGIYAFCGAVIMSIVLSLMVDIFDHKAKVHASKREREDRLSEFERRRAARRMVAAAAGGDSSRDGPSYEDNLDSTLEEPLLVGGSSNASAGESLEIDMTGEEGFHDRRSSSSRLFGPPLLIFSLVTTVLVYFAADAFTMERLLHGAGPQLLKEVLGVNFEKLYSFQSLMWTTGAARGWDYMLMGTFGLFCVVGPTLRAVLLVVTVILDQCKCSVAVPTLAMAVNFIGSFCAWEVFAIAVVMVQMLMPSITDTIITNPVCAKISTDGSCLQVEFNVIPYPFATVVVGGLLLVLLSTIMTGRVTHHRAMEIALGAIRTTSSRTTPRHHDYELLNGIEEGADGGLVFETNEV